MRKYIVPAAEGVGADLLEFAAKEIAEVLSGRKSFKTAAKSVGRQTLRKQLVSGCRKRKGVRGGRELAYGRQASRFIPTKSAKQTSRSQGDIFSNISH